MRFNQKKEETKDSVINVTLEQYKEKYSPAESWQMGDKPGHQMLEWVEHDTNVEPPNDGEGQIGTSDWFPSSHHLLRNGL